MDININTIPNNLLKRLLSIPSVQHLKVHTTTFMNFHDDFDYTVSQQLKYFCFRTHKGALDFDILIKLPSTLQSLDLRNNAPYPLNMLDSLPQGLISLTLYCETFIDRYYKFPPYLTHLRLPTNTHMCVETLRNLPSSITLLNLNENDDITDDMLPNMPPNLTYLDLTENYKITINGIRNLPRSLTTFVDNPVGGVTDETILYFPPGLTRLKLNRRIRQNIIGVLVHMPQNQ